MVAEAVAKAVAKGKNRERPKEEVKEEEPLGLNSCESEDVRSVRQQHTAPMLMHPMHPAKLIWRYCLICSRKLPQQEGEKVVEEMSTLDALECLGLCPANFEWFELNVAGP